MEREDFMASAAGSLVPTERGQWAFVPHALPPERLDHSRLTRALSEAAAAVGELNGIGRTIPNPYLLIRPLQRREAISSSSMEGTHTTVDALLLAEAGASGDATTPDTREVLNYRHALTQSIESLDRIPLSLRTLRNAHGLLLSNVRRDRGSNASPGEFKRQQNFIGAYQIEKARFVPPPPAETLTCLDALERYWHREDGALDILIDAALIHYQFETIHPFADGNGRVGRMLIILHLFMRKIIAQPLLYLSPVFEARKDEYVDRMYAVSRHGEWEDWIVFFLNVLRDSARETITLAERMTALQGSYRVRLQKARRSAGMRAIIDYLFEQPVLTIPMIADRLRVTYKAAQKSVEFLVQEGVLSEVAGTSNPRFFAARDIIQITSEK